MTEKLVLTESEVRMMLGVSRTTLWRMRCAGRFPAPIQMGTRSVRYRRSDVVGWVNSGAMVFEQAT
ncbi:helix-turn-helix transcriptional regulator [Azospirillum thermophilum]|uniref:Helix-turn-helix domain-containing protein n=1 Tax=Azospirillum thermophilum TaxID=2202148 RepID=A0A2S2CPU0_9PROT|nr:hypothetical protein DEW08_10095 [Azospirillum thermophilum]